VLLEAAEWSDAALLTVGEAAAVDGAGEASLLVLPVEYGERAEVVLGVTVARVMGS
jgi:hypothetical protein